MLRVRLIAEHLGGGKKEGEKEQGDRRVDDKVGREAGNKGVSWIGRGTRAH